MPQINASDFKKGLKVILDGEPYDMLECNFKKPGKGQALYITKLRNILKGTILDRTYRSGDSLEAADIRKSNGVYSYYDASGYVFMEDETFDTYSLTEDYIGELMRFLKEGAEVQMLFWNGQLIDMTPPQHVVMEVTYTEPAAKGNTATNVTKAATVETGAEVQVPAFVKQGDMIKIDASTGAYIERVRE